VRLVGLDVLAPGRDRAAAGLPADHFASVICNPPFYPAGQGTPAVAERAGARQMPAADLDRWVKTAATHAAPDGEIVFIHTAAGLEPLLRAFESRFGAVTVLPLGPRENRPASRILIRGIKGSRAPLMLLPQRTLHGADGRGFAPPFATIFMGDDRLVW
jgi:tRNA1(Val) A37 N6-methylase TrmN6